MLSCKKKVLFYKVCVYVSVLSRVQLFATSWTVALQAPLSIEFSRQEYWIRLPFPPPADLPGPGIEPMSLVSPALAGGFFTTLPPGKIKEVTLLLEESKRRKRWRDVACVFQKTKKLNSDNY